MNMIYKSRLELFQGDEIILASIGKRLMAFIIDWVIVGFILYELIKFLNLLNMDIESVNVKGLSEVEIEMKNSTPGSIFMLKILFGLVPILYFTLMFYFAKGQTIGKKILRIKVISLYHDRLGLWHCIERSLGYFASVLELSLGYFQAFWNPNRMALHDKIAETIVISLPPKKHKIE